MSLTILSSGTDHISAVIIDLSSKCCGPFVPVSWVVPLAVLSSVTGHYFDCHCPFLLVSWFVFFSSFADLSVLS